MVERATRRTSVSRWVTPLPALGETTVDIYLNARTCWRNVPVTVWTYKSGGYQILKKWLPTANAPSSAVRSRQRKSNISPTPPGGSGRSRGSRRVVRLDASPRGCRQNGGRLIACP